LLSSVILNDQDTYPVYPVLGQEQKDDDTRHDGFIVVDKLDDGAYDSGGAQQAKERLYYDTYTISRASLRPDQVTAE
jgi:hypothetical protein